MNVLIISHMYPSTFNKVGGIFVYQQAQRLRILGCEIRVISPRPWTPFPIKHFSKKWRAYSEVPEKMIWDGIYVWYPRYLSFPKAWFLASSGKRMHHGIKDVIAKIYQEFPFDLIHAHVALPDGYAGALLALKYHKPLIVTIHGLDLQHTIYRNLACPRAISYVLNSASRTIMVSQKLRQLAIKYFNVRDKLIVVPNGIEPRDVPSSPVKSDKPQKGYLTLLSVSNLVQTKGIYLNLYALQRIRKKYPALRYVLIGGGSEEVKLRKLAKELGLENRVNFLGRQPHHQVISYMAGCDVFTLPSWNEGFGIVYLEAMASSKPVIGCRGEGIEDFVKDGKTGMLVKPKDVDSLVNALDFLLSHPEEARAMGERARSLVLENYTWEKNAEKMIKVYEEVLNAR